MYGEGHPHHFTFLVPRIGPAVRGRVDHSLLELKVSATPRILIVLYS